MIIRDFQSSDASELLQLMRELAKFEGYIEQFCVTEGDLLQHGLGQNPRFRAFVALNENQPALLGMAVTYVIPWTYDLKPTVILKELFIHESARGEGIGNALMKRVASYAVEIGAPRVQWTVLNSNDKAMKFYRALGAKQDLEWLPWALDANAINKLV